MDRTIPMSLDLELAHVTMVRFRSDAHRNSRLTPCPFVLSVPHGNNIRRVGAFPACVQCMKWSNITVCVNKHLFYFECEPIIVRNIYDPLSCVLMY